MWRSRFIILLVSTLESCIGGHVYAGEWHLLELQEMNMEASRFGTNRDPLTPSYSDDAYYGRVAANFNLRLLDVFYWNNYVHTEGTTSQVRTVGWQWDLGLHVSKQIDFFYQHHSRHVMDAEDPVYYTDRDTREQIRYPMENSYGIRLRFYVNPNPSSSLFQ